MKNLQKVICVFFLFGLSACVTNGNSQPSAQTQSEITQASMMNLGNDCNTIVHSINAMDNIIVNNSQASSYSNTYTASNVLTKGLAYGGAYKSAPYLGAMPGLVNGLSSPNYGAQAQSQQLAAQAQQQKARLIQIFQQKQCVRVQ